MKNSLIIFFMLSYVIFSYSQNSHFADIYITPRRVNYGWGDNGIFEFELKKKSIKVPSKERTYMMLTPKRRVYELFYTRVKISDSLYQNLTPVNKKLGTERIIILASQKDTIFIDTYYNVGIKGKCYEISNEFKDFLEKLMPITIRENWQKHLPRR